ncbi:aldehyde dehydrogenase family protein [Pseudonocardia halophobica]|uniref:aldehyde dehydrogenase family protein n=1 Tax=Pseudonocardia halophobica TaxID=29401 RepID=UPI003D8D7D1D
MTTTYGMYIGGEWVPAASGETLESVEPYTGEVWATFPKGDARDVDAAVSAAYTVHKDGTWARDPKVRARLLNALADRIEAESEKLAAVESRDNGKTIREELGANKGAATWYRYAAALAETVNGESPVGNDPNVLSLTQREPYGVIGIQTPWNTPSVLLAQTASMALAGGNAIVVKPSELAPCSILELGKLVEEVGFPAGVFNIVTGLGPVVGEALGTHPRVAKLALTGGPEAGRLVASQAAARLVPTMMELGGKSANIVFADVDLDEVAPELVLGFTGAGGQSCVAGTRVLVHRSLHDELLERMTALVEDLTLGDPSDMATDMGPMATPSQVERVRDYVARGEAEGARVVVGGPKAEYEGTLFFPPTIFGDVKPDMTIAREEIFGPVLAVLPFDTEAEAVDIANDTEYGLAAGVWTNDLDRAHRVSRALEAGTVWVNQYRRGDVAFPFGGYGASGYGRVNGMDGYREMTRVKSIQIRLRPER